VFLLALLAGPLGGVDFVVGLGSTLRLAHFILLFWLLIDTQRACCTNSIRK
jgi:hypothetical protein